MHFFRNQVMLGLSGNLICAIHVRKVVHRAGGLCWGNCGGLGGGGGVGSRLCCVLISDY